MAAALTGAVAGGANSAIQFAFNKALQEDAQQFQTNFYKKRYQRQMADMRKAGLNPILSYRTGVPGMAGGGIASITGGAGIAQSAEAGAKIGRIGTEKDLLRQQTATSAAQAYQAKTQANVNLWERRESEIRGDINQHNIPPAALRGDFYRGPAGRATIYTQEATSAAGAFLRGVRQVRSPFRR